MGQPDIVVVINDYEFYEYDGNKFTREIAVKLSIDKFEAKQFNISQARQKADPELLDPAWERDDIKVIRVFEK